MRVGGWGGEEGRVRGGWRARREAKGMKVSRRGRGWEEEGGKADERGRGGGGGRGGEGEGRGGGGGRGRWERGAGSGEGWERGGGRPGRGWGATRE